MKDDYLRLVIRAKDNSMSIDVILPRKTLKEFAKNLLDAYADSNVEQVTVTGAPTTYN